MTRRRLTILLSMVPESLEDHLEMNIGRLDTYASSPTLSRKLRRLTPIVVVLFPWSWTHSRGTTKAKEKAQKAKPKMIRAIPTRTWFATCATRKAIARPIVGTQRPMEALVNHQVRRAVPSPTPRVAKERGNRKVKATGKAPKARLEGEAEGDQAAEQEWPDGDEPEREGNLGLLCVARGSSTGSVPSQGRTGSPMDRETAARIVRPEHGNLSWFWSRPWDDVFSECKRDRSKADSTYRCTVPNCKGYSPAHGLEAHWWSKLQTMGHPVQGQWDASKVEAK